MDNNTEPETSASYSKQGADLVALPDPEQLALLAVARQSGSESPTIRIRIRDCDVAIVFLLFVAGKRYV